MHACKHGGVCGFDLRKEKEIEPDGAESADALLLLARSLASSSDPFVPSFP